MTTSDGAASSSSVTSSAIDTTGRNLIVVVASWYSGGGGTAPTVSDSKGNTWTANTARVGTDQTVREYYCVNPTVGAGHTFTVSSPSAIYPCVSVLAVAGAHASSPFGGQNGAGGAGTSLQPGSVTPTEDNCLVVTGLTTGSGTGASANGGFTSDTTDYAAGVHISGGVAYLTQTTAAAANPTWSWAGSGNAAASISWWKAQGATIIADRTKLLTERASIPIALTRSAAGWSGSETLTVSGVSGVSKVSQTFNSSTSYTLVVETVGASTGTLTISDGTLSTTLDVTTAATSRATGTWSAAATWDTGEPPNVGHTGTIQSGHTVTQSGTDTMGTSPAGGNYVLTVAGTLTVNGTLVVRGGITFSGTINGSGTLEIDASNAASPASTTYPITATNAAASFAMSGSSGSHAVVRSNGGGGNAYLNASLGCGLWACQYVEFTRIGDATNAAIQTNSNTNPGAATVWLDLQNNTFDACGRVFSGLSFPANAGWRILGNKWSNTAHAGECLRLTGAAPGVGVVREIGNSSSTGNGFDKTVYASEDGLTALKGNVFDGGFLHPDSSSWGDAVWADNFIRQTDFALRGATGGNTYVLAEGTDNPHVILPRDLGSQKTAAGMIVEYAGTIATDDGNWFYGSGDWIIEEAIVLPGVNAPSAGTVTPLGSTALTFRLRHCTLYAKNYGGGVLIGDGGETAGQVPEYENCIGWVENDGTDGRMVTAVSTALTTTANVVTPAGAHHNGRLNLHATTPYMGVYSGTTPGANDQVLTATDPATVFVDRARNLATWAATRGSASGTYAGKLADARGYLRADPTLLADLFDHVRGGLAVKYSAWRTVASDGTVLGAVQDAPPPTANVPAAMNHYRRMRVA